MHTKLQTQNEILVEPFRWESLAWCTQTIMYFIQEQTNYSSDTSLE